MLLKNSFALPQEHLDGAVRPALLEQCAALTSALKEFLPHGWSFQEPSGGYFVWVQPLHGQVRQK